MPVFDSLLGYNVYFHSNENNEPIHVHVGTTNCSIKIWMLADGGVRLETKGEYGRNIAKFKSKDIKRILLFVSLNREQIINKWMSYFGSGQLKNF